MIFLRRTQEIVLRHPQACTHMCTCVYICVYKCEHANTHTHTHLLKAWLVICHCATPPNPHYTSQCVSKDLGSCKAESAVRESTECFLGVENKSTLSLAWSYWLDPIATAEPPQKTQFPFRINTSALISFGSSAKGVRSKRQTRIFIEPTSWCPSAGD